MGVIAAQSDDIQAALKGDQEARKRVVVGYWVFPHIQHWLEEMFDIHLPVLLPVPPPRPSSLPVPLPRPLTLPVPLPEPFDATAALLMDPLRQEELMTARSEALREAVVGLEHLRSVFEHDIARLADFGQKS